jgi:hypothetical protein
MAVILVVSIRSVLTPGFSALPVLFADQSLDALD